MGTEGSKKKYRVMVFGIGAFTQGVSQILKETGAEVFTYLTREYAHYGPKTEGITFDKEHYPNPCEFLKREQVDFIIPMFIDWALQDWTEEFLQLQIPILCPVGEAYKIERERSFSQHICNKYGVPFARSFVAQNKVEAIDIVQNNPAPYVIKNTLCSPSSPVHTVITETVEQTYALLEYLNYQEGVFLQEYLGRNEAGHIAFISNGEIYSLATNQEYKRAFDGNQGIVVGVPLGGLVEQDPTDKYGLAKALLHPLLPWFRQVNFHGPIQVTALWHQGQWCAVEFNVRIGVTSGPLILRMLKDPLCVIDRVVRNQQVNLEFFVERQFGCNLTLAGYGYPYTQIMPPNLPVQIKEKIDCDIWWNDVDEDSEGNLFTSGQRLIELAATGKTVEEAITKAYQNIEKVICPGSYYRTDIGKSLWPPIYVQSHSE